MTSTKLRFWNCQNWCKELIVFSYSYSPKSVCLEFIHKTHSNSSTTQPRDWVWCWLLFFPWLQEKAMIVSVTETPTSRPVRPSSSPMNVTRAVGRAKKTERWRRRCAQYKTATRVTRPEWLPLGFLLQIKRRFLLMNVTHADGCLKKTDDCNVHDTKLRPE